MALPEFQEPGQYIRYFGPSVSDPQNDPKRKTRYILLLERMAPLKYPYRFSSLTDGEKSSEVIFDELDPSKNHIYQAFLGIKPGARIFVWHPYDTKILKWDETIEDIEEDYTANLTYKETPYEKPEYEIWIKRDDYPALVAQNITYPAKTINPEIIWIAAKFNFQEIDEKNNPELFDKLEKRKIPSKPVTFGGSIE